MKRAVELGVGPEWYPVGREITDTWNGEDAPLIVAQYLDSSNNEAYGGAEGVIVVRKYSIGNLSPYSTNNNSDYVSSSARNYLSTDYYEKCSDSLKSVISNVSIPYFNGSSIISLPSEKWFLMSAYEVCGTRAGSGNSHPEGIIWDYWKQRTGWSSPNGKSNEGRIIKSASGLTGIAWLRSRYNSIGECFILTEGSISWWGNELMKRDGILPACFIGKTPTE